MWPDAPSSVSAWLLRFRQPFAYLKCLQPFLLRKQDLNESHRSNLFISLAVPAIRASALPSVLEFMSLASTDGKAEARIKMPRHQGN
jgi:hypothetical protein